MYRVHVGRAPTDDVIHVEVVHGVGVEELKEGVVDRVGELADLHRAVGEEEGISRASLW